ncbi:hypothetical protein BJP40_06610 [Streptomyces sp. CC53]|uniref:hypothetical protein n=1 Tax=Streptomyces sp. CC53 TaxID=1906740 RepID=UPI0008DD778D|nr:hypothetical protein [Streptomyces sp. CC53]OII61194.1 hypothetical protein BJP40_06610 [Streptomyces sp. CC53]
MKKTFTPGEIQLLMSEVEDDLLYALHQEGDPPERDQDLLLLMRRMVATRLVKPTATFEEMVADMYDESPEEIRSWWDNWS